MAVAQPSAAPSTDPGASLSGQFSQLSRDIAGQKKQIAASTGEEEATERTAYKGYTTDLNSIADQFHKLKTEGESILKPFTPPKPEDPTRGYGASLAGLMGIVSAFSGGSVLASMQSATAAINAARQNNSDEYSRAFNEWKVNNDLAMKKLTWENEQLRNVLDLSKTNYDAATAHARTLAAITQDKALMVTLDSEGLKGAAELYDARIKGQEAADKHSLFLLQFGMQKDLDLALKSLAGNTDNGPQAAASANAGRKIELRSVAGPQSEFPRIMAGVEGFAFGKTTGLAATHVQTREALEQLKEKTLDAFRTSQVGRSLAKQMSAVEDIVPKGGFFTTYSSAREKVLQTRQNLASLMTDLIQDAQSAYAIGDKGKLVEDIAALNKAKSVIRDYDSILQNNPDPNVVDEEDKADKSGGDKGWSIEPFSMESAP